MSKRKYTVTETVLAAVYLFVYLFFVLAFISAVFQMFFGFNLLGEAVAFVNPNYECYYTLNGSFHVCEYIT